MMKGILYPISILVFGLIFICSCSTTDKNVQATNNGAGYVEVPMPEELISEEYPKPDVWAKYPGGKELVHQHVMMKTRIPESARKEGYGGRLIITYVIDEEGRVGEISELMSPHPSITEMYESLILNMNRWEPAILNDEPVKQQYIISVIFRDHTTEN